MENTVSLTKSQTNLARLMDDYNTCKLGFESAPKSKVEKGKAFDRQGYKVSESARVKWDLALARVVEFKQDNVNFLDVRKEGITTIMVYNGFGNFLDDLEDMTYDEVDVPDKKTKVYTNAANGSIQWKRLILTGDINNLFGFKLQKWFDGTRNVKQEFEDFCKDVSNLIRYNPHKDMVVFEDYIHAFFKWYEDVESDEIMIMEVYNKLIENLQLCFYADVREKILQTGNMEDEIRLFAPKMFVQDCSKICHANFVKLRVGLEDKKSFLDSIVARGLNKKASQMAKFNVKKPQIKSTPSKSIKDNEEKDGQMDNETFEDATIQNLVVVGNKKRERSESAEHVNEEKEDNESVDRSHKKRKLV